MPSRPCKHPFCAAYVAAPAVFCPTHAGDPAPLSRARRGYDQVRRDGAAKTFYDSAAWRRVRAAQLTDSPLCACCHGLADTVHHTVPLAELGPAAGLDRRFLESVCAACHSAIEAEIRALEQNGSEPQAMEVNSLTSAAGARFRAKGRR